MDKKHCPQWPTPNRGKDCEGHPPRGEKREEKSRLLELGRIDCDHWKTNRSVARHSYGHWWEDPVIIGTLERVHARSIMAKIRGRQSIPRLICLQLAFTCS